MTSNNNETLGQTKQRHKLELRTLQNEVKAFQKKAKKDRLSKKEVEAQIEADMILAQLTRYGLKIKDIPSDGHCMYHAVADQIKQKNLLIVDEMAGFQHLRKITSEYMLARPDNFSPFMALDESAGGGTDYAFIIYCNRVATTADWGGQLELRALACALRITIEDFSAKGDVMMMGREFIDEADENAPKLQLTYHLHYSTLDEHFNSVTPL
ncbi:hypothetical protein PsorP6_016344 [Peronosclerospora sorghi]|uniref:Uncharacterized protein n=2 Tax=Peronosclerospora sorghi TaxID=230839 RepID=A0ACC0VLL5_9STRA|nr:hypothetical protein PsorP6_016343 [Peronosclerospora sorghi]KAI9907217.1 hypothetical protein PsorP6_016344 [Peronosclerospora sorghi]